MQGKINLIGGRTAGGGRAGEKVGERDGERARGRSTSTSNRSDGAKCVSFATAAAVACLLLLEYMRVDEITTEVFTGLTLSVT